MDYRRFIAFVLILSTTVLGIFPFLPKGILYRWPEMPELWPKFGQPEFISGVTSGLIPLPEFNGKYTIYNPEYDCYLGLRPLYTNGKESGVSMYCHPDIATRFVIFGPIHNTIKICVENRCLGDYASTDEMAIYFNNDKNTIYRRIRDNSWIFRMQKIITNDQFCKSFPDYYYPLCLGIIIPISDSYSTNWGYSVNTCIDPNFIGVWTLRAV